MYSRTAFISERSVWTLTCQICVLPRLGSQQLIRRSVRIVDPNPQHPHRAWSRHTIDKPDKTENDRSFVLFNAPVTIEFFHHMPNEEHRKQNPNAVAILGDHLDSRLRGPITLFGRMHQTLVGVSFLSQNMPKEKGVERLSALSIKDLRLKKFRYEAPGSAYNDRAFGSP